MLTMNQKNELRGLLVEIELKVRRAQQMLEPQPEQDELSLALGDKANGKPSYDDMLKLHGEEGPSKVIEELMELKTLQDQTRSFLASLYDNFKTYKTFTPKQHSALAKIWWHNKVKEK